MSDGAEAKAARFTEEYKAKMADREQRAEYRQAGIGAGIGKTALWRWVDPSAVEAGRGGGSAQAQ